MSDCFEKFKEILNRYFSSILCSTNTDDYSLVSDNNDLSRFLIADENEYKLFSQEDENNLRSKIFNNNIENSLTQSCPESCAIVYER